MIFPKRWVKAEIYSKKFEIWWCKANEMEFGFHKLNTWSSVQRVLCWVKFIKFQAVVLDVFQDFQVQKSLETGRDRSTPWGLTPMISHESPPSFLAHRRWKDNLRRTAIYIYIDTHTRPNHETFPPPPPRSFRLSTGSRFWPERVFFIAIPLNITNLKLFSLPSTLQCFSTKVVVTKWKWCWIRIRPLCMPLGDTFLEKCVYRYIYTSLYK